MANSSSTNEISQEINQELRVHQNIKADWKCQLSNLELELIEKQPTTQPLWGIIKHCDKIKFKKWKVGWELDHEREHSLKKRGVQYDKEIILPIIIWVPHKFRIKWKKYLTLKYPSLLEKFKDYPSSRPKKMTKIYVFLNRIHNNHL